MQQYATDQIRNIVLLSQKGAGKTSLVEAVVHTSGATSRLGTIDDGNTLGDFLPDEIRRKTSLSLSVVTCEWKKTKLNFIDTPGDPDFIGEIASGTRIADAALLLVDATGGIEVGTELGWKHAKAMNLPVFIVVNRMDRDNTDFDAVVESLTETFGPVIPMQIPYGSARDFNGIVDLAAMQGVSFDGGEHRREDVPEALEDQAGDSREMLVEAVAAVDDDLTEKYLEDEEITSAEMTAALKTGVAARELFPVFCTSAARNYGSAPLLDALAALAPQPKVVGNSSANGAAALAFKTIVDPNMGRLTFLRVYSGELTSNFQVRNILKRTDERLGPLSYPRGKEHIDATTVVAGDICSVAKLASTLTGDTLAASRDAEALPGIAFPNPAIAFAITPKTKSDLDKLGTALSRVTEEDPTIRVTREDATGETLMWGIGDGHLNVAVERLQSKFSAEVNITVPQVPYLETVRRQSKANGRFKRQTGGHGQFGDVTIVLEPLSLHIGEFEFLNQIVGGAISRSYVPAVEKGIRGAMSEGILAGYPIVGCKVRLVDGKEHQVDSSDQAFQLAGAIAFREAAKRAGATILEPVYELRVSVPDNFTGAIISDLNSKRARVSGTDQTDGYTVVIAESPLAEVQRYAVDLRQITQARGSFTIEFIRYEEVPTHLQEQVIAARAKASK